MSYVQLQKRLPDFATVFLSFVKSFYKPVLV